MGRQRRLLSVAASIVLAVPLTAVAGSASADDGTGSTPTASASPDPSADGPTASASPAPPTSLGRAAAALAQLDGVDGDGSADASSDELAERCVNSDGRAEEFSLHDQGQFNPATIDHRWETTAGGGYGAKASLGGGTLQGYRPDCAHNAAGKMHVFVVGTDLKVWVKWQSEPHNSTSYIEDWNGQLGAPSSYHGDVLSNVTAFEDGNGRLEIFVLHCISWSVCPMYTRHQRSKNGSWTDWTSLGGNFSRGEIDSGSYNKVGAAVAGIGTDNKAWCAERDASDGAWSGWHLCT